MTLPQHSNLSTDKLGSVFSSTSATYKFYWFIAILELFVKKGKERMVIWEIIAEMIGHAWYPIHYFHLSFGRADSLEKQIREIREFTQIPIDRNRDELVAELLNHPDQRKIKRLMRVFTLNVPFRFLSPWISANRMDERECARRSEGFENGCLYALSMENEEWIITINPDWHEYLRNNFNMLKDFAYWNLARFVQARNPNVPDIINKLIKPIERRALTKQREFWNRVIKHEGGMYCIYTNKLLQADDYDLDHFIPWSFVVHDQIWNLLPSDSSINSSKSNKLPDLEEYLPKLAIEHQKAVKVIYGQSPNNRLLEEYCTIIDRPYDLIDLSADDLESVFRKTFSPLYQIASNMSFEKWTFEKK